MAVGKKRSYKEVKDYIEQHGFKLLSKEYKGGKHKLDIQCSEGHKYAVSLDNFRKSHSCKYCSHGTNTYVEKEDCYEIIVEFKGRKDIAYISKEDYTLASEYKWRVDSHGYLSASTKIGNVFLHKLIKGNPPKDSTIDHFDRNRLNNKRENLRFATWLEQAHNKTKRSTNKTGRTGVSLDKNGVYTAQLYYNEVRHMKCFSTSKYGKKKAFEMACKQREEWEIEFNILTEK